MDIHAQIARLFADAPVHRAKKREILIQQQAEVRDVFFLTHGYVRGSMTTEDGNTFTINIYSPGALFPISQVYAGIKHSPYTCAAISSCEYKKVNAADVKRNLETSVELTSFIASKFARGLEGMAVRMQHLLNADATRKVALAFIMLSHKFGVTLPDRTILIRIIHTHQDIADIAGISRETATKELLAIERDGIILNERRSTKILDLTRLYALAGMNTHTDADAFL